MLCGEDPEVLLSHSGRKCPFIARHCHTVPACSAWCLTYCFCQSSLLTPQSLLSACWVKIYSGVPTLKSGTCIVWEFLTDPWRVSNLERKDGTWCLLDALSSRIQDPWIWVLQEASEARTLSVAANQVQPEANVGSQPLVCAAHKWRMILTLEKK